MVVSNVIGPVWHECIKERILDKLNNLLQEEECKKFLPFDDVVKLVHQAEAAPDKEGNYHDYVELCKLYDKNENGTMMLAELENILSNLGNLLK